MKERERGNEETGKEAEKERGDPKEAEWDDRNHKNIERKTCGPSTPVNFFRFGYEMLLLIEFSCWIGLDLICFCFGFLKHRMIERDTEGELQIVETQVQFFFFFIYFSLFNYF